MDNNYFAKALSNFTYDMASGGAIRHMADLGMTVKEISQKLDYPTPVERIQQTVWKHYIDVGVILLKNPSEMEGLEKVSYVKEQDSYGRTSFRRVVEYEPMPKGEFVKCEFGKLLYQDREGVIALLRLLGEKDMDYILGLPWPLEPVYHRKDERIERILRVFQEKSRSQ